VKLETFELHPDRAIAASAVYEALAAAVQRLEVPGESARDLFRLPSAHSQR
jgi:hypothetical protein